jgi:SAM-dependent methyltransferase
VRRNNLASVRRVLDVGCGPGTNAALFEHADYVGIDISNQYIETARRRCRGRFITADVRTHESIENAPFDFILVNSLLHHLETSDVARILRRLNRQLSAHGHIHILDLVLPNRRSVSQVLARADRGGFPRPLEAWARLFRDVFDEVVLEPFCVSRLGVALWEMVYFKGRARR